MKEVERVEADRATLGARSRMFVRAAVLGAVVVVGVVLLGRTVDPRAWLTADGLRATVHAGAWYAPLLYVATFVATIFLPVPKVVVVALAGVLFGSWQGFVWAWIAQVLGMTLLFVLARGVLRDMARDLMHRHFAAVRRIDALLERHGFRTVALLRLFYFMGTPWSIVLATTRLRLVEFVAGTAVGVVPAIALAVVSGDAAVAGATGVKAAIIGVCIALVLGVGTVVRRRLQV